MTVTDNLLIQMRSPPLAILDMGPTLVSESHDFSLILKFYSPKSKLGIRMNTQSLLETALL
ncbi:hypothetical protein C4K35_4086 [Pseudomonas chlororaphis subsp. piscium]|nr:hypothetical protein C4K35_4086 [Pseudomonas chlororaphis subsp. piscium]